MANLMQYTFRLFGPRKGLTVVLNGHRFVNGLYRTVQQPNAAGFLMRSLSYFGAYAMGTAEYEAALKREKEAEASGSDEVPTGEESDTADANDGEVQSQGGESASEDSSNGAGDGNDSERGSGILSEGDGHNDARVPDFSEAATIVPPGEPAGTPSNTIKAALMKLDPDNNEHWTKAGLPALLAVETALGRAGVTRRDVESAFPGYTRDQAIMQSLGG